MAKESDAAAMSEDSIACLEEVKKGKPRKFAMICKGASIVSMVIYKKGNVEKRKKEAKEAGKGQFYFGVVDGKGPAIRFVLARADGFESEPVKTTVLKGFLDESAEMKCKPFFEIIDSLPLVLDEDDPLVARFLKLQEASVGVSAAHPDRAVEINALCGQISGHLDQAQPEEATARLEALEKLLSVLGVGAAPSVQPSSAETPPMTATTPPPPLSDAAVQFMSRLKTLKPAIDAAMATPNANPEIKLRFGEAAAFARKKEFEPANQSLDQVEALIKSAIPAAPPPPSDGALRFTARLKALKPAIDAAITAPGANPEIKLRLSEAAGLARQKEFEQANQALDRVEMLINSAVSGVSANDDMSAQFIARLKALKPAIDAAMATPSANPDIKLRFSEVAAFARKKEFDQANQLLDQVESLIQSRASTTSPHGGDAETQFKRQWTSAKSAWQSASDAVDQQISQLQSALRSSGDKELEEIAEFGLNAVTGNFKVRLMSVINDIDSAGVDKLRTQAAKARNIVSAFQAHIQSDEKVSAVDDNPFAVAVTIRDSLGDALGQLDRAIELALSSS